MCRVRFDSKHRKINSCCFPAVVLFASCSELDTLSTLLPELLWINKLRQKTCLTRARRQSGLVCDAIGMAPHEPLLGPCPLDEPQRSCCFRCTLKGQPSQWQWKSHQMDLQRAFPWYGYIYSDSVNCGLHIGVRCTSVVQAFFTHLALQQQS